MIEVYNLNLNKISILQNAFNITYKQRFNNIWHAGFSLPIDDEKNNDCQHNYYIKISDNNENHLFRIIETERNEMSVNYKCEHVIGTLIDDIMFKQHQIGGMGIYTQDVLQYILSFQTTTRWILGAVDFNKQFLYHFENENLLSALFSVPKCFIEEYQWTWDTENYPWTLNLIKPSEEIKSYIRWRNNLKRLIKTEDSSNLCTRLYVLGYGEGVNQLNIKNVNPTGECYIDADTQQEYGIITKIWVDRRYKDEHTLYNVGKALLEKIKVPKVSYKVDSVNLYKITNDAIDKFNIGDLCKIKDKNIEISARIIKITKKIDKGGEVKLEISNNTLNITDSIQELNERNKINETYSQGATNLENYTFADNCDPYHPAVIKFYIPEETVGINKIFINYETEQFRSYSKAINGGGAVETTTSSGGGTISATYDGGGVYETIRYSQSGEKYNNVLNSGLNFIKPAGWHGHGGDTSYQLNHNHGIPHLSKLKLEDGGYITFVNSGAHAHAIWYQDDHTHDIYDFSLEVDIPDHNHYVMIPGHNHDIEIPDHTHSIQYGIFKGPTATSVTLKVDGNVVPGVGTSVNDLDIIPYLSKDTYGKINRGWHEITITPNNLTRITANITMQCFVQSRGNDVY